MITIETILEDNNKNNNSNFEYETEFMNVLSGEQIQIKSEKKTKINPESTKIDRSVPETRTIVQENKQIDGVKSKQYNNSSVPDPCTIVQDLKTRNNSTDTIKNVIEQTKIFKDKTGK